MILELFLLNSALGLCENNEGIWKEAMKEYETSMNLWKELVPYKKAATKPKATKTTAITTTQTATTLSTTTTTPFTTKQEATDFLKTTTKPRVLDGYPIWRHPNRPVGKDFFAPHRSTIQNIFVPVRLLTLIKMC